MLIAKQTLFQISLTSIKVIALASTATPVFAAPVKPLLGGFYDVGTLGGNSSFAGALSADGNTVVGSSNTSGYSNGHAFSWTNGTMTDLGTFGGTYSHSAAVSADGSVVVGYAQIPGAGYNHAFRWTVGGAMIDIGTAGGRYSNATAVSADGSTVIGDSANGAFRWNNGTGTILGTLGGTFSTAKAVSADGSIVVGYSVLPGNTSQHAFRWENDLMTDLGTLGGPYSVANAVSADGRVVVGSSRMSNLRDDHAFRWEVGGTMTDLGTLGGSNSDARMVSADGSVIAGNGQVSGIGYRHAFRWENGTMSDLGVLPGMLRSYSRAMSADGSVIVGNSSDNSDNEQGNYAFRWSQSTGMQSVTDWVTSSGEDMPAGYILDDANSVSADGTTVSGYGHFNGNRVGWLAKAGGGGFLSDTTAFDQSIVDTGGSAAHGGGLATSNLALFGSHHRTLLDSGLVMDANGSCGWSTADAARNDTTKANTQLAEIGLCRDVAGFRIGAGIGTTFAQQTWNLGGNANYNGKYILVEADKAFTTAGNSSLQASIIGYYGFAKSQINRAYANGAGIDISTGAPNVRTSALKVRLDWKRAGALAGFSLSPYTALTLSQSRVDAYTETGGAFPAVYSAARSVSTDLRIGSVFAKKITQATKLRVGLEYVHQFQSNTAGVNGQVTGLYTFGLPGQTLKQDWARMTLDVDYTLKPNMVLTAGFAAATTGNEPTIGVTFGLRASF